MKRIIAWCSLFLILAAYPAYAAWNITQQDDGTTVWTDSSSNTNPVGSGGVVRVMIDDMASGNTHYILTHKHGFIKKAYIVYQTAFTGSTSAPSVILYTHNPDSQSTFAQVSNPAGATVSASTGTAGNSGSTTFTNANEVTAGGTISIVPSTKATCGTYITYQSTQFDCAAEVVIVIE